MFSILRNKSLAKFFACTALVCACVVATFPTAQAQSSCATRVGYYEMMSGAGEPIQVAPIVRAGFTPVQMFTLTAAELQNINVLFVINYDNSGYYPEYMASLPAIRDAVAAGMTLVMHDRYVAGGPLSAAQILPGGEAIQFSKAFGMDINVLDWGTQVSNGPGGALTNSTLDNVVYSTNGFANASHLPTGARKILTTGSVDQIVTFSYPHGNGQVVYSSVPLDWFLYYFPTNAFSAIYTPNVLAYAASLRPAANQFSFVPPVTADYGGALNAAASLMTGGAPLANVPVAFTLFGTALSGTTDAAGRAVSGDRPLGNKAVGTYSSAASATFSSARFCNSSASADVVIKKIAPTVSVSGGGSFVYDANPHAESGSVAGVFADENFGSPAFSYVDQSTDVASALPPVDAGSYRVDATFAGNENYLSSTNSSSTITITPGTSETAVATSVNSSVSGQSITITASVNAVAPSAGTPAGHAFVKNGTTLIGSFAVPGGSLTAGLNVAGSPHSLTAEFVPSNNNFTASTSPAITHTVTQADTTIALATLTPNPSPYGESIAIDATVAPVAPGGGVPAGTVQFSVNGVPGPSAALVSGVATVNIAPSVGVHTITAAYVGSSDHASSTSTDLSHEVSKGATTTTVQGDAPSVFGQTVTLTAAVKRTVAGPDTLSGTVTFFDGATVIGNGTLDTGIASFATDKLSGGAHAITATYNGNAIFETSSSAATTQEVARARATISVRGYTGVYDGQSHGASGSAAGGSDDLSSLFNFGSGFTNVPGGTAHWTFAGNTNYADASGDVVIEITPADASVAVQGFSGNYDGVAHTATGSAVGVGKENLGAFLSFGGSFTDAPGGSASWAFEGNANYLPETGSVAIAIAKAPLTVTADNKSATQGQALPDLTASVAGFVHGQTLATSGVTGEPTLSTTANEASNAGTYSIAIALGTLASTNYSFGLVPGTLTLATAPPVTTGNGAMDGIGHLVIGGAYQHFKFYMLSLQSFDFRRFEYWTCDTKNCSGSGRDHDDDDEWRNNDRESDYGRIPGNAKSRFVATAVTQLNFTTPTAVVFSGTGTWNGVPGATFEAHAFDIGDPGRGLDRFSVVIKIGTTSVANVNGIINGGNIRALRFAKPKDRAGAASAPLNIAKVLSTVMSDEKWKDEKSKDDKSKDDKSKDEKVKKDGQDNRAVIAPGNGSGQSLKTNAAPRDLAGASEGGALPVTVAVGPPASTSTYVGTANVQTSAPSPNAAKPDTQSKPETQSKPTPSKPDVRRPERANAFISVQGYTGIFDGHAHRATGTATGVRGEDLSSLLRFGSSFSNAPGGTAHWTFAGNANYSEASGDVQIDITPATAVIVVRGFNGVYDGAAHSATGSATGVANENLGRFLSLGASFTDAPGGTATWTFRGNRNYEPATGRVAVNIAKAPLTVTADNKLKTQGQATPELTASIAGFVKGHNIATSGVTGEPALSTTADTSSPAGSYPIAINAGTLASTNYSFAFVPSTLTVTVPRFPAARPRNISASR